MGFAMMRQYELVDRVVGYDATASEDMLNRAYVFATHKHGDQKRASGDPYFSHPVEVAGILTDLHLDAASIATALLHDTIEDTDTSYGEIETLFGREIADLVDGVTKLSQLELSSTDSAQAENFRKLLLATASDIRILLIKLADRLHNMRTLQFIKSAKKRNRIAQETLDIYAPLAGRMGIQRFREELEDLAFMELNSEARNLVLARLDELARQSSAMLDDIAYSFSALLGDRGLRTKVYGRQKRPFSIWRKMQHKSISLEQLSDVFGYRIIVDDEDACYRALGILHRQYRYVPGRYKDYISTPKLNGYKSLHTTIVGPNKQRVEVQIRTEQMHAIAENGVAAHWAYKDDDVGVDLSLLEPFAWLQDMVAQIRQGGTAEEFMENTRLELFNDQVFCFTPKGRLIALPRGATALDFAYAVHTEIGNSCVGVRINGLSLPFRTLLKNGDEIEVITEPDHLPSGSRLYHVVTGKARAAIRHSLREAREAGYSAIGKNLLENLLVEENIKANKNLFERVLAVLEYASQDALFADIGRGELAAGDVLRVVMPNKNKGGKTRQLKNRGRKNAFVGVMRALISRGSNASDAGDNAVADNPVAVPLNGGLYGTAVQIADDCFPLPGDAVVGIVKTGEGVTVYPTHAPELDAYLAAPERWVQMRWDSENLKETGKLFATRLQMTAVNRTGSLSVIAQTIADFDANIANLALTQRDDDFCDLTFDIQVRDVAHAEQIIDGLKNSSAVNSVKRVLSGNLSANNLSANLSGNNLSGNLSTRAKSPNNKQSKAKNEKSKSQRTSRRKSKRKSNVAKKNT